MKRSIHIATIKGIPIDVNYTWFVIFGLVTWTLAIGYFPLVLPLKPDYVYWIMSIISALLLFVSLLAHELSHALVAIKQNLSIKGITLFIFGGIAHLTEEPHTPAAEFKMAIAGPICSFSISVFFFVLTKLFMNLNFPLAIIAITNYLFIINLIVGIFNLIPGFPLDGGRVLRSTLWAYFQDIKRATRIASGFGKAFAVFLIGVGFIYLFLGAFLSGIWLIFIGLFLQEAAESSYQHVLLQKTLLGSKVRDLMSTDVITVSEDMPLDFVIDNFFFKFRHASFPVVNPDENLVGLITLHNAKEVSKDKWNSTYVRDLMLPLNAELLTRPSTEIMSALNRMVRNKVGRLIVIEDHKLVGMLSQRDIMRLFEVKSDLSP